MHHSESGILSHSPGVATPSPPARRFPRFANPGLWINRISRRWSIHQKIGSGYFLAVSIAVLGTATGLIVGEYYDDRARESLEITQERLELMEDLEQSFFNIILYQERLKYLSLNQTIKVENIIELNENLIKANSQLSKLQTHLSNNRELPISYSNYTKKSTVLLNDCDRGLDIYQQTVRSLLEKINSETITITQAQSIKSFLLTNLKEELIPQFETISANLDEVVRLTEIQQQQAKAKFKEAKILRASIIAGSMMLSIGIAAVLAIYTSRAIARPIQSVTRVAEQATQEGNFNLQAAVTTEDEIGVLATSLNHLIQRVATQIRDLQQAQVQLIQSEKMSSLGRMVAGLAHEINNPVNFIYGNLTYVQDYTHDLLELLHLYQQQYPQPSAEIKTKLDDMDFQFIRDDLPKIMNSMEVGSERIRQIILSLRNFSRLDEAEMKRVDLHEGIDNTLLILNSRLTQTIKVIKQYGQIPLIECYPAQLNQVFMNIINNAIDELTVESGLAKRQILIQTQHVNSDHVEIKIQDTGSGIPPDIKPKIFDPFFTTKPVGQGTGMGLAISYQIIEKHQGKIKVISELGQGSEFIVSLPIKPE
ncbi:MAG: ATP-binding protein [Coleofasciculus sp. B1-GNL1-01]|uniref:ATP-binding protein n=1 Tax=Coleofasciculus sp. B1-GNL1-01 TaxID=3068484 RepID=UPI0032F840E2